MPLYMRLVQPVNVGRDLSSFTGGQGQNSTFANLVGSKEEAANRTLANVIRQLASLGKHANEIFGKKLNHKYC